METTINKQYNFRLSLFNRIKWCCRLKTQNYNLHSKFFRMDKNVLLIKKLKLC